LAGRYPQEVIESIRGAADIVQVISDYVPLKSGGSRLKGLCPFHTEKTPSFSVDPKLQLFYCFGCSTGGDLFKFVMLYEDIGFTEAAELLAKRFGVPLPQAGAPSPGADDYKRILAINEAAEAFFKSMLTEHEAAGRCRSYLEERGLSAETIERLTIGYAPGGWEALRQHLLAQRFTAEEMQKAGVVLPRRSGSGQYDRFRDRLMFVIKDVTGRTVAFGGRALDGDTEPKYINSPETPAYKKGEHLYGLDQAREAIRREGFAVVVEGYMDLAALVQAGVENVVASCGTAFTPQQARLLARYSNRTVFSYDGDGAGAAATARSLDLLLEHGFEVRVVELPAGQDPDDYIRSEGAEAYRTLLAKAPAYLEFLIHRQSQTLDRNRPDEKVAAVNAVLPHVAKLTSAIARGDWASKIADAFDIEDSLVLQELRDSIRAAKQSIRSRPARGVEASDVEPVPMRPLRQAEALLVSRLLRSAEERRASLEDLEAIDLSDSPIRPIVRTIVSMTQENREVNHGTVFEALDEKNQPLRDLLTQIAFREDPEEGPTVKDCLWTFKQQKLTREGRRVRREINQLQRSATSSDEVDRQLRELQQLARARDAALNCEEQ
jgi:DNA primase